MSAMYWITPAIRICFRETEGTELAERKKYELLMTSVSVPV